MITKDGHVPDPKRKRIAVIANNAEQLKTYKTLFKGLKKICSARFVWKPEDALKIIQKNFYDLVLIEELPLETIGSDIIIMRRKNTRFLIISTHGACPLPLEEGDIFFNVGSSLETFMKCLMALLLT